MSNFGVVHPATGPDGRVQQLKVDSTGALVTTGAATTPSTASSVKITDGTDQVSITDVSGKKSLDVNVTDITITHANDSIRVGDGANFLSLNPSGSVKIGNGANTLAINGSGNITVEATGTVRVNGNYTTHFVTASAAGDMMGQQDVNEYAQVCFNLRNTFVATVQILVSTDTGAWWPTMIYKEDGSAPSLSVSTPGNYYVMMNGRYFKPNITSYTSGTAWFSSFVPAVPRGSTAIAASGSSAATSFSTVNIDTQVSVGATSTQLLAANSSRKFAYITNNASSAVFVRYGSAAVSGRGLKLQPNATLTLSNGDLYLGQINAIATSTTLIDVFEGV